MRLGLIIRNPKHQDDILMSSATRSIVINGFDRPPITHRRPLPWYGAIDGRVRFKDWEIPESQWSATHQFNDILYAGSGCLTSCSSDVSQWFIHH